MNPGKRQTGVSILLAVVAVGCLAAGLRWTYTSRVAGGYDLYIPWSATCGWITEGRDPYSAETTARIQEAVYGRPARPGEIQADFAYPAYAALLILPLCLSDDFSAVYAVAMALMLLCILATAVLARRVTAWRPVPWLWVWTLVWVVLLYPTTRSILLGQLAVAVALILVGALEALRLRRDVVAGCALALATIKPQMAILVVPMLLFWAAWQRRWRVIGSFAVALTVLVAIPMIWLPAWPLSWLAELRQYTGYTEFGSSTWVMTTYGLHTPAVVEIILTLGLLSWLIGEAWRARAESFGAMLWAAALATVLTHFISPRTATTHFGPLLLPLFMLFRVLQEPGQRRAVVTAAVLPVIALTSWLLFLLTVDGIQENAWNYVPIPLAALIALVSIRRPWLRLVRGEA